MIAFAIGFLVLAAALCAWVIVATNMIDTGDQYFKEGE